MSGRGWWRTARLGLPTVLGLARRGWFVPYCYAATLPEAGASPPYPAVEAVFAAATPAFLATMDRIDACAMPLRAIATGTTSEGPRPRFDQAWYPTLDACAAYTILRDLKPRRIVEVGSGHSTRFLARAAADGGYDCAIVAIDPAPRADIARLPGVTVRRQTVHEAGLEPFAALGPGDVLFVDSSHVLMPGSDVDLLFNRVLPMLPAGVVVHVHDIALPDDYPADWGWRNYNEQQGVVPLLTSGTWTALFSSHFVATRHAARVSTSVVATLPAHPEARPMALWLRKES